jgi:hypothetical protein
MNKDGQRRNTTAGGGINHKILKVNQSAMKEIQENEILHRVTESNKNELRKFDITLSGCSATLVI